MFTVSTSQDILQKSKKSIALLLLCALLVAALVTGAVFCLLNYKVEVRSTVETPSMPISIAPSVPATESVIVGGDAGSVAIIGGASDEDLSISAQIIDPNSIYIARPYDIPSVQVVSFETRTELLVLAIALFALAVLPLVAILLGLFSHLTVDPTTVTGRAGIGKTVTLPIESIEKVKRNALLGTLTLQANGKKKRFFLIQNAKEMEATVNRLLTEGQTTTEPIEE